MNRWTRRLHRWGAFITVVPMLLVIITGLLLQVKKQVPWVQPPTQRGTGQAPTLTFDQLLEVVKREERAAIETWDDVARIDVRVDRGIIKVVSSNHWELQVDGETGDVLSSTMRRSDWIESLHDGSFFHDGAKLWIFLPNGLILLGLWLTGVYLWWLPFQAKRNKQRRQREAREKTDGAREDS
ncbi:MAG: PepSY domain-containing protein [Planctomycetales bacterium]|nr:PepSY domain-containing protein [Planctomycetales bacterium]